MSEFVDFLHEVFAQFGAIRSRRMFGGYGIYHDGLMFALVADDELYLKADDESMAEFEQQGLTPFEYHKNGRVVTMRYYRAPEAIFDDPEQARYWAQLGYDAARRARVATTKQQKGRKNGRRGANK